MGEFSQFRYLECIWQTQPLLESDRASADFFSLHKKFPTAQKLADAIGLIRHSQARLNPLLNRLNRLSDSDKSLLSRSFLHRLTLVATLAAGILRQLWPILSSSLESMHRYPVPLRRLKTYADQET